MNAHKTNNKPLTLDEQIAALLGLKERQEKVMGLVQDELNNIRELDKAAIDSKNAADQGNTQRGGIWENVRNIALKVYDATVDAPDTRYQVFSDVLDEFLNPKGGDAADKVKLTTAGQYASTGRKFLVTLLTDQERSPDDFREAGVKEVREAFKDGKVKARSTALSEPMKQLRYAAKHGTDKEWHTQFDAEGKPTHAGIEALVLLIEGIYNPIKARKDKNSKKAEAARAIPELQQQAPAEPAVNEVVAGEITDAAELEHLEQNNEVLKKQAV